MREGDDIVAAGTHEEDRGDPAGGRAEAGAAAALHLDLRGLNCPLPVLKTRRALARLEPGRRVTVEATDPMSEIDLPHMCRQDGHRLLSAHRRTERLFVFEIERGPTAD